MAIPTELKWLYKEIWVWRIISLVALMVFAIFSIGLWLELDNHITVVEGFQKTTAASNSRQVDMLKFNSSQINKVEDSLQKCAGCHHRISNNNNKVENYNK
jgi:hypothetical protein